MTDVLDGLRVDPGAHAALAKRDSASRCGLKDKASSAGLVADDLEKLRDLQVRLWAEARRSVLLVLQGMDTSGKGGTVAHVVGQCDPSGLHVATFGRPTAEELEHDFLWRIRRQLPKPGKIGVFDRSHYEDVLAARVRGVGDRRPWGRRYKTIIREVE